MDRAENLCPSARGLRGKAMVKSSIADTRKVSASTMKANSCWNVAALGTT